MESKGDPQPETRDAIFAQDWGGYRDVMFTYDNPHDGRWGEVYKNIQLNYEKMRRVALAEHYSAVWVVESDTIPPPDALRKLLETDAPIVSGVYPMRHGDPYPNLMSFGRSPGLGSALKWIDLQRERRAGRTQIPISGGCMGCLLIRRPVLEQFEFILSSRGAPDVPLMEYCWTHQIPQVARLDVLCGHKRANGEILTCENYLK